LVTRTIFGEQYRSLISSLCSSLHPFCLVPPRPEYSPQHTIVEHPQPPSMWATSFHTHTQQAKL
jgi:hypothetical protein